jgi:hypothetical protein
MKKTLTTLTLTIILLLALVSCKLFTNDDDYTHLNYSSDNNWVATPTTIEHDVDVFYVYPTVSSDSSGAMAIRDDSELDLATGTYLAQASVFTPYTNVFAPLYRQMSTRVHMPESGLATDTKEFQQGAIDVEDAFEYYIDSLNCGRPFIIAGHSQGSMALIELIKNRFADDQALRDRLVAAYLIGYTVTNEDLDLSNLTAAQTSNDVGVVITFNTQSPTSLGGPMLMPGANCINPLNWSTDSTYVPASENLGTLFFNDETGAFLSEELGYCDAKIDLQTGALTTNIPLTDTLDIGFFPEGVYHRYDYSLWYRNLQENVQERISAFLNE